MKLAVAVCPAEPPLTRTRFADYLQLAKPRLSMMALFTVAAGAVLAAGGALPNGTIVFHVLFGSALVAIGASALNQFYERGSDALMQRTENRPLPAGRLRPGEVLALGLALGVGGIAYLALALPHLLASALAAVTLLSYVFVYTPLKRKTSLNTLVGAVPGALPPVIGWAAVRGSLDAEIAAVFVILFLWQVPHFLAIAWIYREDYRRAGLCMLPGTDRDGGMSSRQMVSYCVTLLAASLAPVMLGRGGLVYLIGAVLLGTGFTAFAVAFRRRRTLKRARGVLRASLIYLPVLLALLLLDAASR